MCSLSFFFFLQRYWFIFSIMHYLDNISMSMRIFHWKFGVIMPSCPHCVHNWLFMNYLYSDGKKCNSHLCSHALTVFWSRISYNLFVISNISFFISCSDLIWSRMFSGFFFAKSVSEGGGTSMEYGKFPVAVKRSGGF